MNANIKALKTLQNANSVVFNSDPNLKSFKLTVRRYFTDTGGQIIAKNTVPSFAQTIYPVYLFAEYDRAGGYYIGNKELPPMPGLFYIFNSTVFNFLDFVQFSGVNTIVEQLAVGDHVIVFADDRQNPNFFVWIVISGERRSYGSILQNPLRDGMNINKVKLFVDAERQFYRDISFINYDEIGTIKSHDKINPFVFKTISYEQDGFIDIAMKWNLNNWNGLYFYMEFVSDEIGLIFNYKK